MNRFFGRVRRGLTPRRKILFYRNKFRSRKFSSAPPTGLPPSLPHTHVHYILPPSSRRKIHAEQNNPVAFILRHSVHLSRNRLRGCGTNRIRVWHTLSSSCRQLSTVGIRPLTHSTTVFLARSLASYPVPQLDNYSIPDGPSQQLSSPPINPIAKLPRVSVFVYLASISYAREDWSHRLY